MNNPISNFDIHKYLIIIRRRVLFLIIPFVLVYLTFLLMSFLLSKTYQAQAIILVEDKKIVNPLLNNLAISTSVQGRLSTLREEILAWPRLFQLVEKLKLNENIKDALQLERLITGIRSNIILTMKSNDVVVINYNGSEPQSTQKLVNTLCDILIERNLSLQNEDTTSAIDFINEQLVIYKEKLNVSEDALRKFKEVYGLGKLQKLDETASSNKETIRAPQDNEMISGGGILQEVNKELGDLEAELVILSIDNTDLHPRVQNIKRRTEILKEKRDKLIKESAEKIGVDPKKYVNIADSLPRQEEELSRLTRDKAMNERLYAMFLERLESAQITERLDNSENRTKFRVIEPARLPLVPIKPNKIKFNILGLILGMMSGVCLAYFVEYIDSSVKNEEELKEFFDSPVLGSIPKITTEKQAVSV